MSRGWETSSLFNRQVHRRFLEVSGLSVFGVWRAGGHRSPPRDRSAAGAVPCAAPGSGCAGAPESPPARVPWQRAGVTSETPPGWP